MSSAIEFDKDDPEDCYNWPLGKAPCFIGLDLAFVHDRTALAIISVHAVSGIPILAQRTAKVFDEGASAEEITKTVLHEATMYQAKVVIDATNNLGFVGAIASRFGREAANRVIAVNITSSIDDALTPVPFAVDVAGVRLNLPRFSLSRSKLFERLVGEVGSKTIRLSKHGDAAILREQIGAIEMIDGAGKRKFDHPENGFDDAVVATGLAAWAARRLASSNTRQTRKGSVPFTSAAWT